MTFWAFGDSFMSHNKNYIRYLANSCNADNVRILGVPGSGLLYTYQQLLAHKDSITQDDVVLIGLTSPSRHTFNGGEKGQTKDWHVMAGGVSHRKHTDEDKLIAGRMYYQHLFSDIHTSNLAHAILSSIFHSILPSLKTKRVSTVLTTVNDEYYNRFNLPSFIFEGSTLFYILRSYLIEEMGIDKNDGTAIMELSNTENHWLPFDGYPQYFFSKIPRVLDELGIEKVDFSNKII